MTPVATSFQYPGHTLWGLQNHRPFKVTYERRQRKPPTDQVSDRADRNTSSSHGDGSSTSDSDEFVSRSNSRAHVPQKVRFTQPNTIKYRRLTTELLILPPFFSQVSIQSRSGNYRDAPSDPIECSNDEPIVQRNPVARATRSLTSLSLTLRKTRLKSSDRGTRALDHLRKQQQLRGPQAFVQRQHRIGDGFRKSERTLHYQLPSPSQQRKKTPKTIHTRCLDLRPGLLPPVHFACSALEVIDNNLADHAHSGPAHPLAVPLDDAPTTSIRPTGPDQHDGEPEAAALERMIAQQLASVSAPAREPSVPGEDGSEATEEDSSSQSSESTSRSDDSGFCVEDGILDDSGESCELDDGDEISGSWGMW